MPVSALPPALQQRRDQLVANEVNAGSSQNSQSQSPTPQNPTPQNPTPQNPTPQVTVNADAVAEQQQNLPVDADPDLAGFFVEDAGGQQAAPQQTPQPAPQQTPQPAPQQTPQPANNNAVDMNALALVEAQQQIIDNLTRNGVGTQQAAPVEQETPFFSLNVSDLTDEERKFFNGKEEIFGKLVASQINKYLADPLNKLAKQQSDLSKTTTTSAANAEQRAFTLALQTRMPELQHVYKTPQFTQFMDEYIPEAGATRRSLIDNAIKTYNLGVVETHFEEYQRRNGQGAANKTQQAVPTSNGVPEAMRQPQTNPTPTRAESPQPRRRLTIEKLHEAKQLMMRKQLSGEKFNRLVQAFNEQQQEELQSRGYQGNA